MFRQIGNDPHIVWQTDESSTLDLQWFREVSVANCTHSAAVWEGTSSFQVENKGKNTFFLYGEGFWWRRVSLSVHFV